MTSCFSRCPRQARAGTRVPAAGSERAGPEQRWRLHRHQTADGNKECVRGGPAACDGLRWVFYSNHSAITCLLLQGQGSRLRQRGGESASASHFACLCASFASFKKKKNMSQFSSFLRISRRIFSVSKTRILKIQFSINKTGVGRKGAQWEQVFGFKTVTQRFGFMSPVSHFYGLQL